MASKNYLIVCSEGNADQLMRPLQAKVGPHLDPSQAITEFKVPQGPLAPKFGSFDNLIRLTDDLAKHDSTTEGCLRRVERQFVETFEEGQEASDSNFEIFLGKDKTPTKVDNFLRTEWNWDELRYPAQRSLQQNLEHLNEYVSNIEDELRNKGQLYSDAKAQRTNVQKELQGGAFPTRNLVDLLSPNVVQDGDFIETEHLTTVVVILARGQEVDFKKWYMNPSFSTTRMKGDKQEEHVDRIEPPQTVIPDSAKQFTGFPEGKEDKDGNSVWRVVLFKSCKEKFASLARQNKFVTRDFVYSPGELAKLSASRKGVEEGAAEKLADLQKFCKLAWSDVFSAWLHIKAMRAFVESALRFGISKTRFSGFIICPRAGVTPALREALAEALPGKVGDKSDDDGEEYFPYVSLGFAPRAAQVSS